MHLPSDIIGKLLLAILIGGAIGAEREYRSKSAGFRTLTLICLGSALFTVFSQLIGAGSNPDRIASNIATGIGFVGADQRIFQKIELPEVFKIHYIEWSPVSENDSLSDYCRCLIRQIDPSKPFSLIGVSFGGIVAIELSKICHPKQTIIISSFSGREELSGFYRVLNTLKLQHIVPVRLLLTPNTILYRIFGMFHKDGKLLLKHILQDTDPKFFRWAINQLFKWDNKWKPESFLHIHGTEDKILPFRANMHAIPVEGGAHLMVYSKAEEVNRILTENLLMA